MADFGKRFKAHRPPLTANELGISPAREPDQWLSRRIRASASAAARCLDISVCGAVRIRSIAPLDLGFPGMR